VIRLTRSLPEPAALTEARTRELTNARLASTAGWKRPDGKTFRFTGYSAGKQQLFEDQTRKCAYCEKREEQANYLDAEHYRPKGHYWWLAWTWENLLFACAQCNRAHKKDQFPLVDETVRLVDEQAPPGAEQPLLIDPFDPLTDPRDHIVFRRERVQRHERWRPHGVTPRGAATIRICGLDRASLLDRYRDHVIDQVRPKVERFENDLATRDARVITESWSTLRRSLLSPGQEFCGLTRDALEVLVPSPIRLEFHLAF
jgi:uncharacterized protein (TIGR02646 family)